MGGRRHPEPELVRHDSVAKSHASRDESQCGRAACFMVCKGAVGQGIQHTVLRISLDLPIPCIRVKLCKPVTKSSSPDILRQKPESPRRMIFTRG